jgi:hypothetical protein
MIWEVLQQAPKRFEYIVIRLYLVAKVDVIVKHFCSVLRSNTCRMGKSSYEDRHFCIGLAHAEDKSGRNQYFCGIFSHLEVQV